ncbi:MAG: DNA polymerase III subunit delta' [Luteimonas sp.]
MGVTFPPWQQRVYAQACEAIDAGRLAHGMLFCGPAQLGKRAVAERLARRLLCTARDATGEPCGTCRSCRFLEAGSHPDYRFISFVMNKEGTRLRTEIVIEQIRELSEKLTLTPQYGGAQVVIFDPADAINHAGCNALLKTLEEPVPGRYLWLLSANPARLPATIRSRCQKLEFRLPQRDQALTWLCAQGHEPLIASEALDAARGHAGLAEAWLQDGSLRLRRDVASDLEKLSKGELAVIETAQRWTADEHAALRLRFAADLALAAAGGLTDPARTRSLAAWFDAANRTRDLLRTTIRADLAVADLLLSWRNDSAQATGRSRG